MEAELVVRKVDQLDINKKYFVHGYKDVKTKFGPSYMLIVKNIDESEQFKMFATKAISSFILNHNPQNKFGFNVKRNALNTYTEVDNYAYISNQFILLN